MAIKPVEAINGKKLFQEGTLLTRDDEGVAGVTAALAGTAQRGNVSIQRSDTLIHPYGSRKNTAALSSTDNHFESITVPGMSLLTQTNHRFCGGRGRLCGAG